jgi:hypothetical protein
MNKKDIKNFKKCYWVLIPFDYKDESVSFLKNEGFIGNKIKDNDWDCISLSTKQIKRIFGRL